MDHPLVHGRQLFSVGDGLPVVGVDETRPALAPLIDLPRRLIAAKFDIHQDGVVRAN